MKKKYLFILLFLVSFLFIGGNFISVQASTNEIEQPIINETDFSNNYEKILTEEIVDVILNNGEMYQIQLFSVEEQGIQFYKKRSQAYNELVKRDDAGTVLLQKYLNF